MSDRFAPPRRADTDTPEPLPNPPLPPRRPRAKPIVQPPLTDEVREIGRRRVAELFRERFGKELNR